jgi:hypothetical protein
MCVHQYCNTPAIAIPLKYALLLVALDDATAAMQEYGMQSVSHVYACKTLWRRARCRAADTYYCCFNDNYM